MSHASTSSRHARGWTQALERAAEAGEARLVGELLAAGATADVRLEGGATPLMRAAARGFVGVSRALLDAGADANARRDDGFTPLILAVFFGHEEVVRLLLERGADPSARTGLGVSARAWAEARGFKAIAELLRRPPPVRARTTAAPRPRAHVAETSFGDVAVRPEVDDIVAPPRPATKYEPRFESPSRGFARSWQASVGVVLVLAACGVGAFALWQRSGNAVAPSVRPAAGATQAAQPLPAPSASDAHATLTPTPTPAGALPADVPGAYIIQPDLSAQPVPVPPAAAAPSVPTVISESGAEPTPAATPRREARDPRAAAPTPDPRRPDEPPPAVEAPRPNPEAQTPPRPSDPQPAPSATPRRRVIQWPPQK
jgi:hypothetical protein